MKNGSSIFLGPFKSSPLKKRKNKNMKHRCFLKPIPMHGTSESVFSSPTEKSGTNNHPILTLHRQQKN